MPRRDPEAKSLVDRRLILLFGPSLSRSSPSPASSRASHPRVPEKLDMTVKLPADRRGSPKADGPVPARLAMPANRDPRPSERSTTRPGGARDDSANSAHPRPDVRTQTPEARLLIAVAMGGGRTSARRPETELGRAREGVPRCRRPSPVRTAGGHPSPDLRRTRCWSTVVVCPSLTHDP